MPEYYKFSVYDIAGAVVKELGDLTREETLAAVEWFWSSGEFAFRVEKV